MVAAHSSCFSLNVLFVGLIGLLLAVAHLPLHVFCTASFSMELMHRDHPESPLHNTTSTASGADYLRSSDSRNPNFSLIREDPHVIVKNLAVKLKLGSLGVVGTLGISITGLSWVLGIPCEHCYNTTQSKFDQQQSTSNRIVGCHTNLCNILHGKCDGHNKCRFKEKFPYRNIGHVAGLVSLDRIGLWSLDGELYLDDIIFGCIHSTEGNFNNDIIGILGLGPNPYSFVFQIRRHSIASIFSYCLPFFMGRSSTLHFGSSAYVRGPSHYLSIHMDISNNMYRVPVTNIRIIGDSVVNMMTIARGQDQPISILYNDMFVMDFTYKFTYVKEWLLDMIISAVKRRTPFPIINNLLIATNHKLCFNVSTGWRDDQMPKIILIFDYGAEYVLEPMNAFEIVKKDVMCLTILSTQQSGGMSIIGMSAQLGKRLVFDLEQNKLSFQPKKSC